ncbi:MAG: efflux RND transporter periplasmic adaptor subunit, partial [Planctomycetes bacterium]|nr:efflux RND transporter periplasmic adaptor subunit [Planctomycetota bacterium]
MFVKQRFFPYKYYVISTVAVLFALFAGNNTGTHGKTSLSTILRLVSTAYAGESAEKKIRYWTCGMHPSVRMDKPGKCPICAMDLVPVYEKGAGVKEEGAVATVELGDRARKLAQVKTDVVSFRSLTKDIYTVGLIEYDERLKSMVSAWIPGRIDKLFVDFTGTQVVKGESMVWIYSPDLVATQEEYLLALETLGKVKESTFDEVKNGAKSLIEASKRRLLWWGVTEKQIDGLTRDKKVKQHTIIYAPISGTVIEKKPLEGQYVQQGEMLYAIADLSNVWMKANIYEYEMAWIKIGQEVEVTTPTYPGEAFVGTVSFIEPFLDDKTRSVKIRCDIPNQHLKLKPSMYANARIRIPVDGLETADNRYVSGLDYACPGHPEITSSRPGICPEDNIPFVKKTHEQAVPVVAEIVTIQEGEGKIEYEYVCPMKCYSSKEPGNCPVCGMKLEKQEIPKTKGREEQTTKTQTVYVCPMECHTSKTDGDCPMCGMHLEKKEIPAEVSGEKLTCI